MNERYIGDTIILTLYRIRNRTIDFFACIQPLIASLLKFVLERIRQSVCLSVYLIITKSCPFWTFTFVNIIKVLLHI